MNVHFSLWIYLSLISVPNMYQYTASLQDMVRVSNHFVRGNSPKKFASVLVNFMGKVSLLTLYFSYLLIWLSTCRGTEDYISMHIVLTSQRFYMTLRITLCKFQWLYNQCSIFATIFGRKQILMSKAIMFYCWKYL